MLPLLVWLSEARGARRHEARNRNELLESFNDAWRLYKHKRTTPFRNNVISYSSAPSEKHILEKVMSAVRGDDTLIYVYADNIVVGAEGELLVALTGGGWLDLGSMVSKINLSARKCTLLVLDIPGSISFFSGFSSSSLVIVCRSSKDFLQASSSGSDPFTGTFARFFGATVRHLPIFTVRELLKALESRLRLSARSDSEYLKIVGAEACLDRAVAEGFPISSPITNEEIVNLQSENAGSFEDGLQSLWGVEDQPEMYEDAAAIANILEAAERFQNVTKSARFFLQRDAGKKRGDDGANKLASFEFAESMLRDLIHIPAGIAVLGSDPEKDSFALTQEIPAHTVAHKDFWISKGHVRVCDWDHFLTAAGSPRLLNNGPEDSDIPKTYVNFFDACRFVSWLEQSAKAYGLIEPDSCLMLPSEAEWEIAARGRTGSIFPWGDEFRPYCNYRDNSGDRLCPVGKFSPEGDSPFGLVDMAGNAWEWTRSLWGKSGRRPEFMYPYVWSDGREDLQAPTGVRRVVRGGAYYYFDWCLRCATRNVMYPSTRHSGGGFRIVKAHGKGAEVMALSGP